MFKRHADHLSLANCNNKVGNTAITNENENESPRQENLTQVLMRPVGRQQSSPEVVEAEVHESEDELINVDATENINDSHANSNSNAPLADGVVQNTEGLIRSKRIIKKPVKLDL